MNFYNFLENKIKNKSILVLGLGKEGKSTLNMLLKLKAANITISDANEQNFDFLFDENPTCDKGEINDFINNINHKYGDDYLNNLNAYDLILKSPGIIIPTDTDINKISSQMELFVEFYHEQIVGITGTKGKSTTSSLLHHILLSNDKSSILAGNIGIPVFDIVDQIKKDSIIVIEMSCHQLEYMQHSPKRAILLNLHQEHLDHYASYEAYCEAKYNIFKHMQPNGQLIIAKHLPFEANINSDINVTYIDYADNKESCNQDLNQIINVTANGFYYKNDFIEIPEDIKLLGKHNIYNIACVYAVICQEHIKYFDFINSLKSFEPLPHRLQYIGRYHDIDFYDDSISTMGEATINALRSVKNAQTVLIGGMDRGIAYDDLIGFIINNNKYIYILMEASGHRIYEELSQKISQIPNNIILAQHLDDAIETAFEITGKNMACILSPASASYGIFRNFEHRGEVFAEMVKKY